MPIIAIGGGEIRTRETLPIDRIIVRAAAKDRPNVLFIGTASGDLGGYITSFKKYYTRELGCAVAPLMLLRGDPKTREAVEERVAWADIVYVGGGNTRSMLAIWRSFGVDDALRMAYARGCVLCGVSAGALCWFASGISDADLLDGAGDQYIELPALGLLPGCFAPHFNRPRVREAFAHAVGRGAEGYAADDGAALVAEDGRISAIRAQPGVSAVRWRLGTEGITVEDLPEHAIGDPGAL